MRLTVPRPGEEKIGVAVLGATGAVGQRFIQLLEGHPWFAVRELVASDRSVGKTYAEAANWLVSPDIPRAVAGLPVKGLDARLDSAVVVSSLPSDVAGAVEERLAKEGHRIFSNASSPRIGGEEEKLQAETAKMLGGWNGSAFTSASFPVSATCTRVPVRDGHTECVSVRLSRTASADEMIAAWREFRGRPQELELPSAPKEPVLYREEQDRPQPSRDRMAEKGMASVVGRLGP